MQWLRKHTGCYRMKPELQLYKKWHWTVHSTTSTLAFCWTSHEHRWWRNHELTIPMAQNVSWEANSISACQEISCLLWNPKVHYRVHNISIPVQSQMHPVHTFSPYFPNIHSNIIFPSAPRSNAWSLPLRITDKNFVCIHLSHACYMHRPSHYLWFYHPNNLQFMFFGTYLSAIILRTVDIMPMLFVG